MSRSKFKAVFADDGGSSSEAGEWRWPGPVLGGEETGTEVSARKPTLSPIHRLAASHEEMEKDCEGVNCMAQRQAEQPTLHLTQAHQVQAHTASLRNKTLDARSDNSTTHHGWLTWNDDGWRFVSKSGTPEAERTVQQGDSSQSRTVVGWNCKRVSDGIWGSGGGRSPWIARSCSTQDEQTLCSRNQTRSLSAC